MDHIFRDFYFSENFIHFVILKSVITSKCQDINSLIAFLQLDKNGDVLQDGVIIKTRVTSIYYPLLVV